MKTLKGLVGTAVAPFILYGAGAIAVLIALVFAYKKLGASFGAGTPDPGGGAASTGIVDGILNHTLEIGPQSSMNYTDAAAQTALHPLDVMKSILGFN